jgi:hypothetical protein
MESNDSINMSIPEEMNMYDEREHRRQYQQELSENEFVQMEIESNQEEMQMVGFQRPEQALDIEQLMDLFEEIHPSHKRKLSLSFL